jgi:hypothetical protein
LPSRLPILRCLFFILTSALLCSCGYQHNGEFSENLTSTGYKWKSLYRDDISTVAVPIFKTRSFDRNIEFALTKAVINQIEARTPYKVVDRDRADTILEGEVIDTEVNTLSLGRRNNIPQEQLYTVKVNFIWKNLHTGRILVRREDFEQSVTYYETLGEDRFHGAQSASEKLAVGIVHELEADW